MGMFTDWLVKDCKLSEEEAEQLREIASKLPTYKREMLYSLIRKMVERLNNNKNDN